jgi:hypothetical protein
LVRAANCWFERFRNKDYSLEDEQRSGRPSEIDLSELKQVIESDPNLSQRDVASKLGCTQAAIQYQLKQLRLVSKNPKVSKIPKVSRIPKISKVSMVSKKVPGIQCQMSYDLPRRWSWKLNGDTCLINDN